MILKLRMPGDGKSSIAWRLLDKIKKIEYKYVDDKVVIERKAKETGILYINSYPRVANPKANKRVTEIYIVYENGLGNMFYTDDMVYIMNDNGKTCDTINI